MSAALNTLLRPVRAVHWYLKEVMGENAYAHYLEWYERTHSTTDGAMCARAFWRDRTDSQDRNPKVRCC